MTDGQQLPKWFLWLVTRGPIFWTLLLASSLGGVLWVLSVLDQSQVQPTPTAMSPTTSGGSPHAAVVFSPPRRIASGQSIYVPIYSHIYFQEGQPLPLTATLSIRNVDQTRSLTITRVEYFDTSGNSVRNYLNEPVIVGPLATSEYLVRQSDQLGGSGANFMVEWFSEEAIPAPVVQAVMVSAGGAPVSFVLDGRVVTVSSASPSDSNTESSGKEAGARSQ